MLRVKNKERYNTWGLLLLKYFLPALTYFFFFHDLSYAQQISNVITYEDSIMYDEEENKIFFPSFVFAEPLKDEIYVIDSKSRILTYTSDLFPMYSIGKKNGVLTPQGLTMDSRGYLYIIQSPSNDNPRHRISVLNTCLKWERDIYAEGFEGAETFVPYRLAVDGSGNIYVAGNFFPGVLVLDNQGKFIDMISPEEEGKKVKLSNVIIDDTGRIYILSEEEGHIYVYSESRKFIFKFGEKGGSSGKLSRPKAVGIDNKKGRIYVIDYMRHTVTVYDMAGLYLFEFGGLGWGEGWFKYPAGLAVDKKGRVIIADLFNHRVQILRSW